MVTHEGAAIQQIERGYRSEERVPFSSVTKTVLEVWEGKGDTPYALMRTVKLDKASKAYIRVKVRNVVTNIEDDDEDESQAEGHEHEEE